MKKRQVIYVLAISLFFGNFTFAQKILSEEQLLQSIWGRSKTEIVTQALDLNSDETLKFMPLYEKYMNKHLILGNERIQIFEIFLDNSELLDEGFANKLTERLLKNNQAIDKLQMEYLKKFQKKYLLHEQFNFSS